jgi:hypothetical protein
VENSTKELGKENDLVAVHKSKRMGLYEMTKAILR